MPSVLFLAEVWLASFLLPLLPSLVLRISRCWLLPERAARRRAHHSVVRRMRSFLPCASSTRLYEYDERKERRRPRLGCRQQALSLDITAELRVGCPSPHFAQDCISVLCPVVSVGCSRPSLQPRLRKPVPASSQHDSLQHSRDVDLSIGKAVLSRISSNLRSTSCLAFLKARRPFICPHS